MYGYRKIFVQTSFRDVVQSRNQLIPFLGDYIHFEDEGIGITSLLEHLSNSC